MPYSKSPELKPRPAWSAWGSRLCLFGGALLFFGSLLPPILTEVNATIRAKSGNSVRRESSVAKPTTEPSPRIEHAQNVPPLPPQGWRSPQRDNMQRDNTPHQTGGTAADRQEIMASYREWKKAWRTTDLDKCMSLYARDIRFSDIGGSVYNYEGLSSWFKNTWGRSGYRVVDWEPPLLRIRDKRAVMLTKQGYGMGRSASLSFVSRYVWEKRAIPGANKQRWLIVEEAYLPFNGDRGNLSQIY